MRKRTLLFYFLLVSFCFFSYSLSAQPPKDVRHQQHVWSAVFGQVRVSDKLSLYSDVHFRWADFLDRPNTLILRPGLVFHLPHHINLTAGYAYVLHYPGPGLTTTRPEHRPWQQISWTYRTRRFQMLQWLRLEERFNRRVANDELLDEYAFNYRFRAQVALSLPLNKDYIEPGTAFFSLINELHVNAGKQIVYNYFDQNRLFAGLGYQFTKEFSAQLGYMNQYVQTAAGNRFNSNHTARLFLFYNLDARRPKE